MKHIYACLMGIKSNFRTTGISCLLSALVALSGAISPAQANASVPATGSYICTAGVLRASGDAGPTYTISNGVVANGQNCAGAVVIAQGVTRIGTQAFQNTSKLYSISIPASVTTIGEGAFIQSGLTSITFDLSSQLTSIEAYAFSNASVLTSIYIPEGVTSIESGAFKDTTSLTEITLPSNITIIADEAFANATALASITIPAGVTLIDEYAFYGASSLMDVNFLGDAPINVDANAFTDTASGAKANISATATGFGIDPTWNGLVIVRAAVLTNGEYVCTTGALSVSGDDSPAYTITEDVVTNATSCTGAVVIPEGVTSIGTSAFEYAEGLTSVTIPASVTFLADFAFYSQSALEDFYFFGNAPASVGTEVFSGVPSGARARISATATGFGTEATWNGLVVVRAASVPANGPYVCTTGVPRPGSDDTSPTYTITNGVVTSGGSCAGAVVIPEGVTSIGQSAFDENTSLNSINIPSSVTSIGPNAFFGATGLSSILIPEGVTSIGSNAFGGATGLSSILIPASVTSIGTYAICETAVTSITVDSANPNYASQDGVLFNKDLTTLIAYPSGNTSTSYVVPSSVTTIEDSSFYKSLFLKSIAIPNSVTSILSYAFSASPNLETVTFASGSPITAINVETFYGLPKLSSIELPANLISIGEWAFAYATALTSFTIPASVTTIEDRAFGDTVALIDLHFLGNAPADVDAEAFFGMASGAKAHIKASATGFGAGNPWTWNGLIVQDGLKEVTHNSAGGSDVASGVVTQGGSIQTAPVSTRDGYTLTGWSATDNGSVLTFPYTPTADITLHAIWTLTATPLSPQAPPANLTKMAEEARARVVEEAKTEIKSVLSSGMPLTAEQLLKADFKGVTTKNIGSINADIAKLPNADKTDLKQIEKVVLKFAIVDKFAAGKTVYSSDLIAAGLIPQDSKIKSLITGALKKLPGSSLDTIEKIKAEIVSVEKKYADRKARLAALLAKKR